jgi:hypothetical protein
VPILTKVSQSILNMNRSSVHLLDLPNEMLFNILNKLDNVDVLYSLLGINNEQLDSITRQKTFSNILILFASTIHNTTRIHGTHSSCYSLSKFN